MGLYVSHGCWSGSYGSFMSFRNCVSEACGYGDIHGLAGYGGTKEWASDDALSVLMNHSDCDGEIQHCDCLPLAVRLDEVSEYMSSDYAWCAVKFANGLRSAHAAGEDVEFC